MLNTEPTPVSNEKTNILYIFLVSFVAAVGGFLFGYDLVIISGAQLFLKEQFALDANQFGFATSSAILGCMAGPFVGMWLCDWIGRKNTLIVAALLFGISAVGTAIPRDITTFNLFRIVGGVGVGLASIASPMYIAEVAPPRNRGALGLMYQMAICVGAAFSTLVAWLLARHLSESVSWRWMFASELIPVICFLVFLLLVPKSPRWLAEKGRNDEALKVLERINGRESADRELQEIKLSLKQESGSFSELFQKRMPVAMLIGVLLAIFNQWTGWSGIAYYLPTIFEKAGWIEKSGSIRQMMFVMMVNILWTSLAIYLVDRWGRKPMWVVTSAVMIVVMFLPGLFFQLNISGPIFLILIILCAAPHAIGLGALPWLIMSELYPTRIRAKAMAINLTVLWFAAFAAARYFPILVRISEELIGSIAGVFWMYAAVCSASLIFGIKLLPETKGRTLEEIASSWSK